ncbi:MAG: hypothetical protein IPP51_03440 [Bacteroidetes bacterium]|nr:hypothetical protein [Bacteroidota bacterium]
MFRGKKAGGFATRIKKDEKKPIKPPATLVRPLFFSFLFKKVKPHPNPHKTRVVPIKFAKIKNKNVSPFSRGKKKNPLLCPQKNKKTPPCFKKKKKFLPKNNQPEKLSFRGRGRVFKKKERTTGPNPRAEISFPPGLAAAVFPLGGGFATFFPLSPPHHPKKLDQKKPPAPLLPQGTQKTGPLTGENTPKNIWKKKKRKKKKKKKRGFTKDFLFFFPIRDISPHF